MKELVLHGNAVTGAGVAASFTELPWAQRQFQTKLGLRPYPGTFNLKVDPADEAAWRRLRAEPGIQILPDEAGACLSRCYPVLVNDRIRGAIILPEVAGYPPDVIEIIAEGHLRSTLGLADADPVALRVTAAGEGGSQVPSPQARPEPVEGTGEGQGGGEPSPNLQWEALAYLQSHNTVSLATTGENGLWASTVFYVNLGFNLYFLSEPGTRHGRNVAANPSTAATINEDYRDWREIKGIQIEGTCTEVKGKREMLRALAAYVKKYPFVASFLKPGQLLRGMSIGGHALDTRLYRLTPGQLFYLDNARGFSNRREVPLTG